MVAAFSFVATGAVASMGGTESDDADSIEAFARGEDVSLSRPEVERPPASGFAARLRHPLAARAADTLTRLRRAEQEGELLDADSLRAILATLEDEVLAHFTEVRERLSAARSAARFRDRVDLAEARYRETLGALRATIEDSLADVETLSPAALQTALSQLPAAPAAPVRRALPYRSLQLAPRPAARTPVVVPSYLNPAAEPATSLDLQETPEAPHSEVIRDQAAALDYDYARIYDFVRNDIRTEWYSGSLKGAEGTLRAAAGNDVDKASLLLALFRVSQLPARYIRGVVRIPVDIVAASLGLADDQDVPTALARAGVPHDIVLGGSQVAAVDVEHTWVAAYAPYANYRGVIVDFSGPTWVPLAPAIQGTDWRPATAILDQMDFDSPAFVDEYLSTVQSGGPLNLIRQQVETFLAPTGETYEDQLAHRSVAIRRLELLPSAMPSPVAVATYEGATLPAELQLELRISMWAGTDTGTVLSLEATVGLAEVTGRRLTFSYTPATAEDDAIVNLYGGLDLVPAYLVHLLPQVKLSGRLVAIGTEPIPMATLHAVRLEVEGAGVALSSDHQALAVAYAALAVQAPGGVSHDDPGHDPADTEQLAARLLNQIAQRYGAAWVLAEEELAGLLDVAVSRPLPSLTLAHSRLAVETLLDVPLRVAWEGVDLDAALRTAEPLANRVSEDATEWFMLAALTGSALEHQIFEQELLVSSISADLGLGRARDDGVQVETLTAANVDLILDAIELADNVESSVRQLTQAGLSVELATSEVSYEGWRGAVWRAIDSNSGTAGYFIAGGLAGGATAELPENWILTLLMEALSAPYSPEPNSDPMAGVEITKLPEGDHQTGVVGEVLPRLLQVRVRDHVGRPVQGAIVGFLSERGGGKLIDQEGVEYDTEMAAVTNTQGIASAILRAGTDVSANPTYVYRYPDDTSPTAALDHQIGAHFIGAEGAVGLSAPFTELALPGEATGLVRTDSTETHFVLPRAGFLGDIIWVQAADQFGNPISNVELHFEVGPPSAPDPACSNPSAGPLNAGLIDASDWSACPPSLPAIGYCGAATLTKLTGPSPVRAGVILGNSVSTRYTVLVSAVGAPELGTLAFTYESIYTRTSPSGRCHPGLPFVVNEGEQLVFSRVLLDAAGNNVQAAWAGTEFSAPIEIRFALWDPDDGEVCIPQPDGTCFPIPFEDELESGVWVPAHGNVQLTLDSAGSLTPTAMPAEGLFQTYLQTDSTPALNTVTFDVTEIRSWFQLDCPACTIDCPAADPLVDCLYDCPGGTAPDACAVCPLCTVDCPGPDCDSDCPLGGPAYPETCLESGRGDAFEAYYPFGVPSSLIDTNVNAVWGITPSIDAFDPDPVPLSDEGALLAETRIDYSTLPAEYVAAAAEVEVYVNDEWNSSGAGSSLSGNGSAGIQQGYELSIDDTNEVELVLNRGTAAEVGSPRVPIPLGQTIFSPGSETSAGYDLVGQRQLFVSQDVDLLNQRVCAIPDLFFFTLTQESRVTLTFEKIGSVNPDSTPVFDPPMDFLLDELLAEGEHNYSVTPGAGAGDLTLGPGDYRFTLSALSTATGLTEDIEGSARSLLRVSDHLPVGHVLVQGVDLFDGHLTLGRADLSIPGRGSALEFRRSYSSTADRELHAMGVGWTHNYDSHLLVTPCGEVILVGGEGGGMRFVDDGAGGLRPLKGHHGTLIADTQDSSFDFYSRSGMRFHYAFELRAGHWVLDFIEDTNGNRTDLVYDPGTVEPQVAAVTDPAGRRLDFVYEDRTFSVVGEVELKTGPVLIRVIGPDGISMSFDYDAHGQLIRAARENDARIEQYVYDWINDPLLPPRQALTSTTNPLNGAVTLYSHDAGLIGVTADIEIARLLTTQVTEPEGGITQFVYDTGGLESRTSPELVHQVIDPRNFATTYRLNQYGSPVGITDPLDNTTTMTWPPDDVLMTSRTDANGHTMNFTYDVHGNLLAEEITVVDAAAETHVYRRETTYWPPEDFDPPFVKDRVATRADRNGHTTSFEYDLAGNLSRTAITVDQDTLETLHSYLSNGDRSARTDPRGNVTQFTYDSYGNLATVLDPLANLTQTEWNARSLPVRRIDALNRETLFSYDSLGRLLTKTMPLGAVEATVYDDVASTVMQTDAEQRVTITRFDLQGREVEGMNPADGSRLMDYDPAGNKTLETTWFDDETPRHDVFFEYDDASRLSRRLEPLGRVVDFTYDPAGNVTRESTSDATDPGFLPRVRETDYDALDRVIRTRRFLSSNPVETSLLLDGEGNLLAETDPLGRVTDHVYDALNRRTETLEPEWKTGERKRTTFEYDKSGNLERQVSYNEPVDQVRTFTYDALSRLVTKVSATGDTATFEYDAVGNLVREIDPRGNVVSHFYDDLDRRERTVQHLDTNVTTRYGYDLVGNLTNEEWPNGNNITHTYDDLDRRDSTTDLLGSVSEATYDARGNQPTATDANGNATTNTYDALDRLISQELPENRTLTFTYDVAGNQLSVTNARAFTTTSTYDTLDRVVSRVYPTADTESFTYDLAGNRLTATDRRGLTTTTSYDALNRVKTVTDPEPLNYVTSFEYDAQGNVVVETDRRTIISRTDYDAENRPVRVERDGLTLRTILYDPAGNKIEERDALDRLKRFDYDQRNLLIRVTDELTPYVVSYVLDDMGDRIEVREGPEVPGTTLSARGYDLRRRVASQTDGNNDTTTFELDGNGNRTAKILPLSNRWEYDYDDADRLIAVRDPLLHETTYLYDGNDNVTDQIDAENRLTHFTYDEVDRRLTKTYADMALESATYDPNGNLDTATDALGRTTAFVYDAINRQTLATYEAPTPPTGDDLLSIATTYGANGNPETHTETYSGPTGVRATTKSYDTFDRLTSVTDPNGETLAYGYNAVGLRATLTDSDDQVTRYFYDAQDRLERVELPGAETASYTYRLRNWVEILAQPHISVETLFDGVGRPLSIINTLNGTTFFSQFDYTYDANGNRESQHETGHDGRDETTTYIYDTADRLEVVAYPDETVTYAYDNVGNRTSELIVDSSATTTRDHTLLYNNRHQLTDILDALDPAANVTYTYDANGNQTAKTRGNDTTAFTFDIRDRLFAIHDPADTLVGSYRYDYQGLRIEKATATETKRYIYDDQSLLVETDAAGGTLAKYGYGSDQLLTLDDPATERQYYLHDALGSVVELLRSDHTAVASFQYDAWGNPRSTAGTSVNAFGFTGHQRDGECGLYYAKARYYDPEIGRFLSEDPFEGAADQPPSLHRYLYGHANPTVFVDPSGRQTKEMHDPNSGALIVQQGEPIPEGYVEIPTSQGRMRLVVPEEEQKPGLVGRALDFLGNLNVFKSDDTIETVRESSERAEDARRDIASVMAAENTTKQAAASFLVVEDMTDVGVAFLEDAMTVEGVVSGVKIGAATGAFLTRKTRQKLLREVAEEAGDVVHPLTSFEIEIWTPQGVAIQGAGRSALEARESVANGAKIYRIGTRHRSGAAPSETYFWAAEPPSAPGFARRYGIPRENAEDFDFIEVATLRPGARFVTRPAPGAAGVSRSGGAIEVVVEEDGVILQGFHTKE